MLASAAQAEGHGVLGRVALTQLAVTRRHGHAQASAFHCSEGVREGGHHGAAASLHLLHIEHHALVASRGDVRD